MKILKAFCLEVERINSLPQEEYLQEIQTNEDFSILAFAVQEELAQITAAAMPVFWKDIQSTHRVNAIVERVLKHHVQESSNENFDSDRQPASP